MIRLELISKTKQNNKINTCFNAKIFKICDFFHIIVQEVVASVTHLFLLGSTNRFYECMEIPVCSFTFY